MTFRAFNFLLLSALFAVYVEESGFTAVYAQYLERLSAGRTFLVVLLNLCLTPRTPDENRGFLAAVRACYIFWHYEL